MAFKVPSPVWMYMMSVEERIRCQALLMRITAYQTVNWTVLPLNDVITYYSDLGALYHTMMGHLLEVSERLAIRKIGEGLLKEMDHG